MHAGGTELTSWCRKSCTSVVANPVFLAGVLQVKLWPLPKYTLTLTLPEVDLMELAPSNAGMKEAHLSFWLHRMEQGQDTAVRKVSLPRAELTLPCPTTPEVACQVRIQNSEFDGGCKPQEELT